jgi:hypothetical protein
LLLIILIKIICDTLYLWTFEIKEVIAFQYKPTLVPGFVFIALFIEPSFHVG